MTTAPQNNSLPQSLQWNPRLDDWIRIDPADTITVRTGKVELGQGITTAVALLAADELDVKLERIRVETADSARAPNEFMTVGSMSIETSGAAVRQAAADARYHLLARAAELLGCERESLRVEDGVVHLRHDPDKRVSYWELMGGKTFDLSVTGVGVPKAPAQRRLAGTRVQRIDIADLVHGARRFVQDLQLPGMLYGCIVRAPGRLEALAEIDEPALAAIRGEPGVVAVARDGSFLGVIAEREEQALAAAEALRERARFEPAPSLPPMAAMADVLVSNVIGSYPLVNGLPTEAPVPPVEEPPGAVARLEASYRRPYLMHGSIGPSAAVAKLDGDALTVWCSSQGVAVLAPAIARGVGLPPERVRLIYVEGPGCYGQNGSDDAALDAALLARAVPGRPVLVQWTRQDEHGFEPYGSAMRVDLRATLDASGRIASWSHDVYSYSHLGRAVSAGGTGTLLAAQQLATPIAAPAPRPMLMPEVGIHRNAVPPYDVPAPRIIKHLAGRAPLRTSSLRSLGAFTNVFAIESAMDELARLAGKDPAGFRLEHLPDERARAVLAAGWARAGFGETKKPGSEARPRGRGLAYSRYENHKAYAAIFVELEVDLASCAIRLLHATIAADAGHVVDLDGLENQLEGGFIQAASWTLKEEVQFDARGVTSLDWASYPILTFEEVPSVELVVIDRPDRRALGAGEATTGPTPAAIANAVFDACGARLRNTPFTPAQLRTALYA